MPTELVNLAIKPASGLDLSKLTETFQVEFLFHILNDEDGGDEEVILQSHRLILDAGLTGTVTLALMAEKELVMRVMRLDGTALVEKNIVLSTNQLTNIEITDIDFDKLITNTEPATAGTAAISTVSRRFLRLVSISEEVPNFERAQVMVSPVIKLDDIRSHDLGNLLGLAGNASQVKSTALDVTGQSLDQLVGVTWSPARLSTDGVIEAQFPQQETVGWLWWIVGRQQLIGLVADDLSKTEPRTFASALKVQSIKKVAGSSSEAKPGECTGCGGAVSRDFSERELSEKPGGFTEDPGSSCKPFSNPERVLGEKSFTVLSRVDTPEIGARSSLKTRTLKTLNLDTLESSAAQPTRNFISRIFSFTSAPAINPKLAGRKLTLPDSIQKHFKAFSSARQQVSTENPVQWEDDIAQYQACTVALGHILEFRMRWRSNGYSLGTVSSSLTLAPRQTKRIQKIEWSRSERASRQERTRLTDEVNDATTRERDFQDEVAASLSEWSRGSSDSTTASVAGGVGFAAPGVVGGVGGGVGTSASTATQEGGRRTAANENQRLRDAIRRHGDSLRKFESTVVQEVSQQETAVGTTETLRNANYAHSITVIYYQILRHLSISTEFAGARECLYVPFSIKPFNIDRAYRWREALQKNIRSPRYLKALRFLREVRDEFANSDIPSGPRSGQRITSLRGSVYLTMAVERPADATDGKINRTAWRVVAPLLPGTSGMLHEQIVRAADEFRDEFFQKNFASAVAAEWCNRIKLRTNRGALRADFTMATAYKAGRSVRVDFTVAFDALSGLTRRDLINLTVLNNQELTPGSVANLTGMNITYTTAQYQRTEQGTTGINDLVSPETGLSDSAQVSFPLDAWDAVDERREIRLAVGELVEHLNEHVEYYHKAIWWNMDRDRLLMLLDGFLVPGSKDVSIATVVDREPLAIIGNCLVYRVGAGSYIGCARAKTPQSLYELYDEKQPVRDPLLVSLPTDGLYARTIMDECSALEEHQGNTDWVLSQPDPELGNIDPSLLTSRRADLGAALTPTTLPQTILDLQKALQDNLQQNLQGALDANSGAFRDMAGLAGNQANAFGALQTAAGLASGFGNQAAATLELAKSAKAQEATRIAPQKIAATESAVNKGLIPREAALPIIQSALAEMNGITQSNTPHENKAITTLIEAASKRPGSSIEAATPQGAVKVNLSSEKPEQSGFLRESGPLPTKSTDVRKRLPESLGGPSNTMARIQNAFAAANEAGEDAQLAAKRILNEAFDRDLAPLLATASASDAQLEAAFRLALDLQAQHELSGLAVGEGAFDRALSKLALAWRTARSRIVQEITTTGSIQPLSRAAKILAMAQASLSAALQPLEMDVDALLSDAGISLDCTLLGPATIAGGESFELRTHSTLRIGSGQAVNLDDAQVLFYCPESMEEQVTSVTDAAGEAKGIFNHQLPPSNNAPTVSLRFGSPEVMCGVTISHKDFPIITGNKSLTIPGKLAIKLEKALLVADDSSALTGSVVTLRAGSGEVVIEFTATSAGVPPQGSLPLRLRLNGGGRITSAGTDTGRDGSFTVTYEAAPNPGTVFLEVTVTHPNGQSTTSMVSIQIV